MLNGWHSNSSCIIFLLICSVTSMIYIILCFILLLALALLGYSIKLNNERTPQMSVSISGVKVYNDHRLLKTLNKSMLRTLQKPNVTNHYSGSGRISRRASTSSTDSSAPTVVGQPTTSLAASRSSRC